MSQALISSSVKLVTVLIKKEIQWNDRVRRGNLLQLMPLFLSLFHSALCHFQKHSPSSIIPFLWHEARIQQFNKMYSELRLQKQAASLTLKTCMCLTDDSKTMHIDICIHSQYRKQKPPSIPISETAEPGLRENIRALPLFILPQVMNGSRNDCKVANCVFAPIQTISQMYRYIPQFFTWVPVYRINFIHSQQYIYFYGNQSNSNDSRPGQLAIFSFWWCRDNDRGKMAFCFYFV